MKIEVVYCPQPGRCDQVLLELPEGATVSEALRACGLCEQHGLVPAQLQAGIWSRRVEGDTLLRQFDRVEIYRPLKVDPKEARRARYRSQRSRPGSPKLP